MTQKAEEKIFTDSKIVKDSSPEEFKDVYIECSKIKTETPMSWIALPDSTIFVASYAFRLVSNYIKQSHSSLLDVGSGRGSQLMYWRSKGFNRVEGCDISPHFALGYAKRSIPYKIVDLNCKDLVLPYKDNEFDVVTCSHVVEHIKYPSIVVEELVRVSKDLVIISAPVGRSHWSESHINFWYSQEKIAQDLFKKDWAFSIEFVISSPLKDFMAELDEDGVPQVLIKQLSFIGVIYKQHSNDNSGYYEMMWNDLETVNDLRKSRAATFLFLSTEDDLFNEERE